MMRYFQFMECGIFNNMKNIIVYCKLVTSHVYLDYNGFCFSSLVRTRIFQLGRGQQSNVFHKEGLGVEEREA